MAESVKPDPRHELRIWIREPDYQGLKSQADRDGLSLSEAGRQAIARHLGADAAGQAAPWLVDALDAVLSKYFQGFPEVLRRLVTATYEAEGWGNAEFLKLLEIAGDKDPKSQDQRAAKLATNIQAFARQRADEFFQTLAEPEEWIEPSDPAE